MVILECVNCSFRWILVVVVWWYELILYIVLLEVCIKPGGAFVVQYLECDGEVFIFEHVVQTGCCRN